jgi:hypothetical protein
MQLTYDQLPRVSEELAPDETRNIPFFGFVTGGLVSLALWGILAWTLWALVD